MEIISEDAGTQFTSKEFQDKCQTCGVWLMLAAPKHQEIKKQLKVTWRMLRKIAQLLMVHVKCLEAYINFALTYTVDHIFLVLPIKDLINKYGKPTTPLKLVTSTKPSTFHLNVLFFNMLYEKLLHMLGQSR